MMEMRVARAWNTCWTYNPRC